MHGTSTYIKNFQELLTAFVTDSSLNENHQLLHHTLVQVVIVSLEPLTHEENDADSNAFSDTLTDLVFCRISLDQLVEQHVRRGEGAVSEDKYVLEVSIYEQC